MTPDTARAIRWLRESDDSGDLAGLPYRMVNPHGPQLPLTFPGLEEQPFIRAVEITDCIHLFATDYSALLEWMYVNGHIDDMDIAKYTLDMMGGE